MGCIVRSVVCVFAVLTSLFLFVGEVRSQAQNVSDIFEQFGLTGEWAETCGPAAGARYAVAVNGNGAATLFVKAGNAQPSVHPIASAHVDGDMITFEIGGTRAGVTYTIKKSGDRMSMFDVRASDGRVFTRNGIQSTGPSPGRASPLLQHCLKPTFPWNNTPQISTPATATPSARQQVETANRRGDVRQLDVSGIRLYMSPREVLAAIQTTFGAAGAPIVYDKASQVHRGQKYIEEIRYEKTPYMVIVKFDEEVPPNDTKIAVAVSISLLLALDATRVEADQFHTAVLKKYGRPVLEYPQQMIGAETWAWCLLGPIYDGTPSCQTPNLLYKVGRSVVLADSEHAKIVEQFVNQTSRGAPPL